MVIARFPCRQMACHPVQPLSRPSPLAPRSPETPKHSETQPLGPMKGPKMPQFQAQDPYA
jgi:hypothetical protein